jgi:hypothetical protein
VLPGEVEPGVISLSFHVSLFDLPFFEGFWGPIGHGFVEHHVSEFIESQVGNSVAVTFPPVYFIGSHHMVEVSVMSGGTEF